LRAEGFFCNLDVLYGGLWKGKLQIDKRKYTFFSCSFSIFGHRSPGSGLVFSIKCWIRMKAPNNGSVTLFITSMKISHLYVLAVSKGFPILRSPSDIPEIIFHNVNTDYV
jgi:hypothetical protein